MIANFSSINFLDKKALAKYNPLHWSIYKYNKIKEKLTKEQKTE